MYITKFHNNYAKSFENLFADYFHELGTDIPEDILHGRLMDHIFHQLDQELIHIHLLFERERCVGFSLFQVDQPESDWCKRPGWGCIREFYIAPSFRALGYGRRLAQDSEQTLRSLGCPRLYLTSDTGIPFWLRCGWRQTGILCSNGLEILEK